MAAAAVSSAQTQQQTASPLASSQSSATSKSDALNTVDFQNFLTLLTAQLRSQDPLDPADSTEFVAQLAQFTSVEQLVNVNSKIDKLASAMVASGIDKYAGWIGKEAEANGAPAYFDGAAPVKFRLAGNSEAAYVDVVVADKAGNQLATLRASNSSVLQSWDGKIDGVPAAPGAYSLTALYYDQNGDVLGGETAKTYGEVREVRLDGDNAEIVLQGGVELTPDKITGLGAL